MENKTEQITTINEWLKIAEQSSVLGGSQRRYDLLRYLLTEELEGRGTNLKAYGIALDVLGRGDDFDPSTDSIVRVEIARLRDALELYYARSQSMSEPLIEIPKGTYRPSIFWPDETTENVSVGPIRRHKLLAVAVATTVVAVVLVWNLLPSTPKDSNLASNSRPVIEVETIPAGDNVDETFFAIGFRQQLVTDLSHLPTISVRDGPLDENALGRSSVQPPDYRLVVFTTKEAENGLLSLRLTSAFDETVLWAKTIQVPEQSTTFYEAIADSVRGIGQEIAGPTGAITNQQARFSLNATNDGGSASSNEYRCIVVSLIYDATKADRARKMSQECLEQTVAEGTTNSTLLAEYALYLFFRSSTAVVDIERTMILNEGLRTADLATEANPMDALPHEVRGNILSALGNRSGAIRAYRRAVELAPSRPAPHFLLGWQQALEGNWDEGMQAVEQGIGMQPNVPGYMIIPLALDAFRREQYQRSLELTQEVIDRGDERGFSLAFAASVALGDMEMAEKFISDPKSRLATDPSDPMREVRVTFSYPDVMETYEAKIAPYFSQ